jgi:hypothetical protein
MAPPLHKAIQDPAAFAVAGDAYIAACLTKTDGGKDSDIISIAGFAVMQGCAREMLSDWVERYKEPTVHDPQCHIANAIKRLKATSELQLEREAVLGRNSMALALGKCKHGWIEAQHVKVEGKVSGSIAVVTGVPDACPSSD